MPISLVSGLDRPYKLRRRSGRSLRRSDAIVLTRATQRIAIISRPAAGGCGRGGLPWRSSAVEARGADGSAPERLQTALALIPPEQRQLEATVTSTSL